MNKQTVCIISLAALLAGSAAANDAGREYFETILAAYGERSAVNSLANYHLTGTVTLFDGDATQTGTVEIFYKKPDRYKQVILQDPAIAAFGRDGDTWWRVDGLDRASPARRSLGRREINRQKRRLELELCHILAFPPGQLEADLLADWCYIDGIEHAVLKIWQKRDESQWMKLVVDPRTRLIRRVDAYLWDGSVNEYQEFGLEFLEYAPRGAVQFPGRIREFQDGWLRQEIAVTAVEFNTQMPASAFRPE